MELHGLDVSNYQKNLNWEEIARSFDFVYVKATEGVNFTDPSAKEKAEALAKTELQFGFYHFCRPSKIKGNVLLDAEAEAKDFNRFIGDFFYSLPPVIDFEWNENKLSKVEMTAWLEQFIISIEEESGRRPIIYTGPSFAQRNLGESQEIYQYPLWIAHYASQPRIPKGWSAYLIWQYTSEGRIDSYDGRLDMNKARPELFTC